MPEPACDIRAQIAAVLDPRHPKAVMFAAPDNRGDVPALGEIVMAKPWGTLVTDSAGLREAFGRGMPDDAGMAAILGYPEPKNAALAACPGAFLRVVQACDWQGNVITDALCSPGWLERTAAALAPHGNIRILTVLEGFARRLMLRCREAA